MSRSTPEVRRAYYLRRRAAGLCLSCPAGLANLAEPGKVNCVVCAAKSAESALAGYYRRSRAIGKPYHPHEVDDETETAAEATTIQPGARCRCFLLLPCHACLPASAAELAQNRDGEQEGFIAARRP
jgi:hypothetical protein